MNILAGHMLGDFLLQNRWLARVKRKSTLGMLLHCAIAALSICIFTGWWDYRGGLVFTAHFAIDYLAIGKKLWPKLFNQGNPDSEEPAPIWLCLVMDQAWHIVTYAIIAGMP